jgi:N utilization substance protein A
VQSIIRELRGEKIDIVEYSEDLVTFAQAALAPARITRVSVTHPGERPHLDVIVEDEQLSLAIGRRGQNVRLASELIGARIDITTESADKDEVADALAKMLQTAMAESEGPGGAGGIAAVAVEIDLTDAPGIGAKTAEALEAAGFGDLATLVAASSEELEQVEGLGPKTAAKLQEWAREKAEEISAEAGLAADDAGDAFGADLDDGADAAGEAATMDDGDFMAALSRAFQESERQRDAEGEANDDEGGAAGE